MHFYSGDDSVPGSIKELSLVVGDPGVSTLPCFEINAGPFNHNG